MTKEKRVCQWCGREFYFQPFPSKVATGRGRFCSRNCAQKAQTHPKAICEVCGMPCNNRFCSRKCYRILRLKKSPYFETKRCAYCGREFQTYAPPCRQLPNREQFCSRKCANKARQRDDIYIPRTCEFCDITFMAPRWHVENRGDGRFCSIRCRADAFGISQRGEGNTNWRGGYDYEYGADWYVARRLALERDVVCQVCGEVSKLHVHHITPYVRFTDTHIANDLANLITLCTKCHPKVERGYIPLQLPLILAMADMG